MGTKSKWVGLSTFLERKDYAQNASLVPLKMKYIFYNIEKCDDNERKEVFDFVEKKPQNFLL